MLTSKGVRIARAMNKAIAEGRISAPIILGRDHHDVSGTTRHIVKREHSRWVKWTADMSVHNFVGDAMRGATWVSLHNGGGVGWGEVSNGGFGMVIDGSADSERRYNRCCIGTSQWCCSTCLGSQFGAIKSIERAMDINPNLRVTVPEVVDDTCWMIYLET